MGLGAIEIETHTMAAETASRRFAGKVGDGARGGEYYE
jgi:hypothetical protein